MTQELENYLASGVVEKYCLGIATPDEVEKLEQLCSQHTSVKKEIESVQSALLGYASQYEKVVAPKMGGIILNDIEELKFAAAKISNETGQLSEFIDVSEHSNIQKWNELIKGITPEKEFENGYSVPLYKSGHHLLTVTWIKKDIPTEIHDDRIEKLLILEGTCTCLLGDEKLYLKAGDCFIVPPNLVHNVLVTSEEMLKAIYVREMIEKVA